MNIVIYAGDRKYYSVLEPIATKLKSTKHTYLFLYTKNNQILDPKNPNHISLFSCDGQISKNEPAYNKKCESLNITLPFKPDVLLLARERWQPEQYIINEFKTKWNAIVCCVEVSSHLINNIENRLEMLSRTKFPQNTIDYYFEHSEWAKQRRIDCLDSSFNKKIIVVGNTRNFKTSNEEINKLKVKYKINEHQKQILFWGSINTTRNIVFEALKKLRDNTKETHQIFYKCYPGEPFNYKFKNDFNPFKIKGVNVIYDENDIYGMANICDTHIGNASSIFNFAFINNKKIVNLDNVTFSSDVTNNLNIYIEEKNNGVEDSAKFWMDIWNLNSIEEFKNLIDLNRLNIFKNTNSKYMEDVHKYTIDFDWNFDFLKKEKKDYTNLIHYFDSYKLDLNAPSRTIKFLENVIKC